MPRDMRVDPTDLGLSANQVDVSADDLRTSHAAAQERVAGAATGWIGRSAKALAAKAEHWEQESASHYTEISGHGTSFRTAADTVTTAAAAHPPLEMFRCLA